MTKVKAATLFRNIRSGLKRMADPKQTREYKIYHKKPGYLEYGILTGQLRKLMHSYKSELEELSLTKRKQLALKLYQAGYGEEILFGNYILSISLDEIKPRDFKFFDRALDYFTGWGMTDDFCANILYKIIDRYPHETIKLLQKWNRSRNMWKRRASVVALTRGVGESGKYTGECLCLCDNLLHDPEDLVQKGVGWALKDNLRGNKKRIMNYLKKLRRQGISSVITLYAMRDLSGGDRTKLLKISKQ